MQTIPKHMNPKKEDVPVIMQISRRAVTLLQKDLIVTMMDLSATHLNGCPLDLQKLLDANDFNFIHDIGGINNNLDRGTGELLNHFLPRCSK